MALADRIVILNEGRIEQIGTPEEIYSKAGQSVRRRLHRGIEYFVGRRRGAPSYWKTVRGFRSRGQVSGRLHLAGCPAGSPADRQGRIAVENAHSSLLSRGYLGSITRRPVGASAGEFRNAGGVVVERRRHRNLAEIGLETGDFVKLSWSTEAAHPLVAH